MHPGNDTWIVIDPSGQDFSIAICNMDFLAALQYSSHTIPHLFEALIIFLVRS